MRADDFLCQELGSRGVTKTLIRKVAIQGKIYCNGRRLQSPTVTLKGGEVLDLYVDDAELKKAESRVIVQDRLRILYEDEAVICIDKPAGLPTQPTVDAKRANIFDLLKEQLGGSYLGMHHRLDRDTSGVLLFTKEQKYNAFVGEQFAEHLCKKQYVALVHGSIPRKTARLESFLGSLGKIGPKGMQKFGSVKSGGKKAITDYNVIETGKKFSILEVSIQTGRTHQIRVHMSEEGHPIVGDTMYGSSADHYEKHGRFFLHAHSLEITHPITKNVIRVESPVPPRFYEILRS